MSATTFGERIQRIRYPAKRLAQSAGLNLHTVHRILHGRRGGYERTHTAIERALVAEELALRDYLVALHPLPEVPARREVRPEPKIAAPGPLLGLMEEAA